MYAAVLSGFGGPDRLEVREVPTPRPGPGQLLVRVAAAAVNNTDINTRLGWYARPDETPMQGTAFSGWTGSAFELPRIQGADGCGYVAAAGSAADAPRVGERVLIDPIIRPVAGAGLGMGAGAGITYLGSECDGCFAQYVAVPAANARRVDSRYSDVELASFPCAYLAAEHMLSRADVRAGETVLVTGASGGVGSAAVQLAHRRGATVLAVAAADKAAAVRDLGASRILERHADLVSELGRECIDAVVDVAGGDAFGALLELLRRRGRYAVAGAVAGPVVALDLRVLYLKDLSLQGCTIPDPQVFSDLIGYIERAEIRPLVARTYPLARIAEAQAEFLLKRHVGKIVLTTADGQWPGDGQRTGDGHTPGAGQAMAAGASTGIGAFSGRLSRWSSGRCISRSRAASDRVRRPLRSSRDGRAAPIGRHRPAHLPHCPVRAAAAGPSISAPIFVAGSKGWPINGMRVSKNGIGGPRCALRWRALT